MEAARQDMDQEAAIRREVAKFKAERGILKKAAAYVARDTI